MAVTGTSTLITTAFTKAFGLRHPIVAAPMAFMSGGELAAQVNLAGGLGMIGAGYESQEWLTKEFEKAETILKGQSKVGNVGVGFITWNLATRPALLDEALKYHPSAVWFSFGDAKPFVEKVRQASSESYKPKVIIQIQNPKDAVNALELGADLIVAQGLEAGGHSTADGISTFCLVPQVVDAVNKRRKENSSLAKIPILAAGGIADGRGLAAALTLGADGVVIGSRFEVATEALGNDHLKEAIICEANKVLNYSSSQTFRTRAVDLARGIEWPQGYDGRVLKNPLVLQIDESLKSGGTKDELEHLRDKYKAAATRYDYEEGAAIFVGQVLPMIQRKEPASQIVGQVHLEAIEILRSNESFLTSD